MNRPLLALASLLTLAITQPTPAQEPTPRLDPPVRDKTLPPIGPITPTMKTLDQVEARIPVNDLPGDLQWLIIIDEPGSYYLTGNIQGEWGKHGIAIRSKNVILDLNGFNVNGSFASTGRIGISGGDECIIQNGSVTGWSWIAVGGGDGATIKDIQASTNSTSSESGSAIGVGFYGSVLNCRVTRSSGYGIAAGYGSTIQNCITTDCALSGITVGGGLTSQATTSRIDNCVSINNGEYGISTGTSAAVTDCTTASNTIAGILTRRGTTVDRCVSLTDTIAIRLQGESIASNCTSFASTTNGFESNGQSIFESCYAIASGTNGFSQTGYLLLGSQFRNCFATYSAGTGFYLKQEDSSVIECKATNNTIAIELAENAIASTIEDCTINNNDIGIQCDADSTIIRNNTLNQPNSLTVTGINNLIINNLIKGGAKSVTIAPGNKAAAIVDHPDDAGPHSNLAY